MRSSIGTFAKHVESSGYEPGRVLRPAEVGVLPAWAVATAPFPHSTRNHRTGQRVWRSKFARRELVVQRWGTSGSELPSGIASRWALLLISRAVRRLGRLELVGKGTGESLEDLLRLTGRSTGGGARSGREALRRAIGQILTSNIVAVDEEVHRSVSPALKLRIPDWQDPFHIKIERINPEFSESVGRKSNGGGVPVDMTALRLLGKDALTWDLLVFVGWRVRGLREPIVLRWEWLAEQLGSAIVNPYTQRQRIKEALEKARILYPSLSAMPSRSGIELSPSPPPFTLPQKNP